MVWKRNKREIEKIERDTLEKNEVMDWAGQEDNDVEGIETR